MLLPVAASVNGLVIILSWITSSEVSKFALMVYSETIYFLKFLNQSVIKPGKLFFQYLCAAVADFNACAVLYVFSLVLIYSGNPVRLFLLYIFKGILRSWYLDWSIPYNYIFEKLRDGGENKGHIERNICKMRPMLNDS